MGGTRKYEVVMAEVEEPRQEEANATKLQMSKELFFV